MAVVTVFAGSPVDGQPLSDFAQSLHDRWRESTSEGIDFSDPPALRREEDQRGLAAISPTIQVLHLNLLDCIYRRSAKTGEALYDSEEALFGDIHPDDSALEALRLMPRIPDEVMLYAPLGVGRHVDHQIINEMARQWGISSERLRYYVEYPYAAEEGALEAVGARTADKGLEVIQLSEEAVTAKIRAVGEHKSQISTFWVDRGAMETAIRAYHEATGGEIISSGWWK